MNESGYLPISNPQMTKAFLPQMKAKNHGHIVTVASALGLFTAAHVEVRPCSIEMLLCIFKDLGALALNLNLNHYFYSLTIEK